MFARQVERPIGIPLDTPGVGGAAVGQSEEPAARDRPQGRRVPVCRRPAAGGLVPDLPEQPMDRTQE